MSLPHVRIAVAIAALSLLSGCGDNSSSVSTRQDSSAVQTVELEGAGDERVVSSAVALEDGTFLLAVADVEDGDGGGPLVTRVGHLTASGKDYSISTKELPLPPGLALASAGFSASNEDVYLVGRLCEPGRADAVRSCGSHPVVAFRYEGNGWQDAGILRRAEEIGPQSALPTVMGSASATPGPPFVVLADADRVTALQPDDAGWRVVGEWKGVRLEGQPCPNAEGGAIQVPLRSVDLSATEPGSGSRTDLLLGVSGSPLSPRTIPQSTGYFSPACADGTFLVALDRGVVAPFAGAMGDDVVLSTSPGQRLVSGAWGTYGTVDPKGTLTLYELSVHESGGASQAERSTGELPVVPAGEEATIGPNAVLEWSAFGSGSAVRIARI